MSDAIAEFFVELGIEIDEAAMAKADRAIGDLGKTLSLGLAAGLAAVATHATVALGALAKWTHASASAATQAERTAAATSLTVETWQELEYAGKQAGIEGDELRDVLNDVAEKARDANDGSEGLRLSFRKLGLNLKEFTAAKPDERLNLLADAFNDMPNSAERTAIAMELMSSTGPRLFEMFDKGSAGINAMRQEAIDLGLVMSKDQTAALKKVTGSWHQLMAMWDGIRNTMVLSMLPMIQGVIDRTLGWIATNRKLISEKLENTIRKAGKAVEWVHDKWKALDKFVREKVGGWDVVFQAVTAAIMSGGTFMAMLKLRGVLLAVLPIAKALLAVGAIAVIKILLVAGLIAFLAFAIDDLITGLQGGESYTKDFLDAFKGSDGVFGKLIGWFDKAVAFGKVLWEFLGVALPLAFQVWWTIAEPWLTMLWDGITAIAEALLGVLGVSLDESGSTLEKMTGWLKGATVALDLMRGRIIEWANVWRDRVQFVVDIVKKLVDLLGKIPLGKIAEVAGNIGLGAAGGGLANAGRSVGGAVSSFFMGDTNVTVPVKTGASPEEIASQTGSAVSSANRKTLQLAYARNEGGER